DGDPPALDQLVAERAGVAQEAERGLDPERPAPLEREPLLAAVGKADAGGIGALREAELVLQLPAPAADAQLDARPEAAVGDLLVGRQVPLPAGGISAEKVVDPPRAPAGACDRRSRARAEECEPK